MGDHAEMSRTSPLDCKHLGRLFICSGRGTGIGLSSRYRVSVCPKCGQFHVFKQENGAYLSVEFTLASDEAVHAAGAYLRGLSEPDAETI